MSDPWLDGQLEDEGPSSAERISAMVATGAILGSVILRGGSITALMGRWNQGSVGCALLALVAILFRDSLSETFLSPGTAAERSWS